MTKPFDEAAIGDARLRGLYRYWERKRARRLMPARTDIDPLDLKPLLGHLFLLEAHPARGSFRYRLAGSAIVEMVGRELTGLCLEDIDLTSGLGPLREQSAIVARRKEPHVLSVLLAARLRRYLCKQLLLPLSSDGENVDMLLGAALYTPMGEEKPLLRLASEAS
jgi:hypothetical protein